MTIDHSELNEFLATAIKSAISETSVDESGAHNHYELLANRGDIIDEDASVIVEMLENDISRAQIHQLTSDAAILALLLFQLKWDVLAIATEPSRSKLIEYLAKTVKFDFLKTERRFRILQVSFPTSMTELLASKSRDAIIIAANLVTQDNKEREQSIIDGISLYQHAIIDLRTFTQLREDPGEQAVLLKKFQDCHFLVYKRTGSDGKNNIVWLNKTSD